MRQNEFEVRCPGCGEKPVYRPRFGVRACSCWVEETLAQQRAEQQAQPTNPNT